MSARTSVPISANPLRGLQPLPKYHHAWPPDPIYLANGSAGFMDGLLHDYVRITGSCNLPLNSQPAVLRARVDVCVQICTAVAANRSRDAPPVLAVQWSPWFHAFPSADPTVRGSAEQAELALYGSLLSNLSSRLAATPVQLGAVLLDSEKFSFNENSSAVYTAELTRKHDLVYNLTRSYFPAARIEMYDRGGMEPCALSSVPVRAGTSTRDCPL